MPDRNGKIFYTSIASLSHINKITGHEAVYAGLDLIDFYVLPHYLTAPFKKVTEKIMTEFSDLNLCPINNHQGIVIDGEGSKVICKD